MYINLGDRKIDVQLKVESVLGHKLSVGTGLTLGGDTCSTDEDFVVVAASVTLCTTIGTSTVKPPLLVWSSLNTFDERRKSVVRASSTVASNLNTSGLDEDGCAFARATVERCLRV